MIFVRQLSADGSDRLQMFPRFHTLYKGNILFDVSQINHPEIQMKVGNFKISVERTCSIFWPREDTKLLRQADAAFEELLDAFGQHSFEPDVYSEIMRLYVSQAWYQKAILYIMYLTNRKWERDEHLLSLLYKAWTAAYHSGTAVLARSEDLYSDCITDKVPTSSLGKMYRGWVFSHRNEVEACRNNAESIMKMMEYVKDGRAFPHMFVRMKTAGLTSKEKKAKKEARKAGKEYCTLVRNKKTWSERVLV